MLTLRVMRHEFLQGLIDSADLQPEQVFFGGRLPYNFLEAGVLDNDQEHFGYIYIYRQGRRDRAHLIY
ncbi:MAG: hypothetical protein ACKPKO_64200, partial [Candidatus Fonsibacter sp.]